MDWAAISRELCGADLRLATRRVQLGLDGHSCEIRFTPGADAADLVFDVRIPAAAFERTVVRSVCLRALAADVQRPAWRKSGKRKFDRAFFIESPSPHPADRWMEAGAGAAIAALQAVLGRHSLWITLCDERLRIACLSRVETPAEMTAVLEACRVVAETAFRMVRGNEDAPVLGDAVPGGACRVCGKPLASEIVECAECRTPTHRDCWRFTGTCPVFSCGSQRYVERRQAPAPPSVAVEAVLAWMGYAVSELHHADAGYADVGGRIGENEQYLKIKRVGFSDLLGELTRAAPRGAPGLLEVLGKFAFHPVLAEDYGQSAFDTAELKRARVVEALARFLEKGEPLPDVESTI